MERVLGEFKKEIAVQAHLHSDRCIRIHGACTDVPGQLIVVMEFAKQGSLRTVLEQRPPPSTYLWVMGLARAGMAYTADIDIWRICLP